MPILGKRNRFSVIRASAPVLYLDDGALGEILLPGRNIPANLKPKDKLDVFIYRDSEDRLVATTEIPLATVGECFRLGGAFPAFSVIQHFGHFAHWAGCGATEPSHFPPYPAGMAGAASKYWAASAARSI